MTEEKVKVEYLKLCRRCEGVISSGVGSMDESKAEQLAEEDPQHFYSTPSGYCSVTFGNHGYSCS